MISLQAMWFNQEPYVYQVKCMCFLQPQGHTSILRQASNISNLYLGNKELSPIRADINDTGNRASDRQCARNTFGEC